MSDYLAVPESGNGAGVLVLHPWWGLNPFVKSVCDRLALDGYVALAPDLYDGAIAVTIEEAETLSDQLSMARVKPQLISAAATLLAHPQVSRTEIGMLGFSLGGHLGQWLASVPESHAGAVVVFYDARPGDYTQSRAAFQFHLAETDPYLDEGSAETEQTQLQAAGLEAEFFTYPGTGHWFFEADRPDAYQPEAAALAWERTLAFLKEH